MAPSKVGGGVSDQRKEVCGYFEEKCTDKGKGSDGILCDYCGFWVHASCDGKMSAEAYKMFTKLADEVSNISYYCSLNHCGHKIRQNSKAVGSY